MAWRIRGKKRFVAKLKHNNKCRRDSVSVAIARPNVSVKETDPHAQVAWM